MTSYLSLVVWELRGWVRVHHQQRYRDLDIHFLTFRIWRVASATLSTDTECVVPKETCWGLSDKLGVTIPMYISPGSHVVSVFSAKEYANYSYHKAFAAQVERNMQPRIVQVVLAYIPS
jgi:hypothetical protein